MDLVFRLGIEAPQLDTIVQLLIKYGDQHVADFAMLFQRLQEHHDALQAEAAQVTAKLVELASLLQQDMADQANVDAAQALVEEMMPIVQGMVPDVPPPPPIP